MKKSNIMPTLVLSCICLVVALLLSAVNLVTGPKIKQNQEAAANATLIEVLPNGKNFTQIEINESYPDVITAAYKADGGFVFRAEVTGYSSGLVILCGIDSDGKIAGVKHIASFETYGMEAELNGAYLGQSLDSLELILATGATANSKTSAAYYNAVKASLQAFAIEGGAEVDTRTPEQILNDNCNAALATENLAFTKWFKTEMIKGVDTVYKANNDAGYVFVIGETFIGIKDDGSVATKDTDAEKAATAKTAFTVITSAPAPTKVDIPEGFKRITEILLTESGNYIITAKGAGYGINGDWHASGEYIQVSVAIDATGKILDTATVYQNETANIGGEALKNPDFTEKFEGKTESDYSSVAGITGATLTCGGYKEAIKNAFMVYENLTGGSTDE